MEVVAHLSLKEVEDREVGRHKPQVEKEEGLKNGTLPFGQVPMLHIDGMDIVQSLAILRYISRKY